MEKEITFEVLFDLIPVVNAYFSRNPNADKSKLGYSLIKTIKKFQPKMDEYESERENAKIDLCLTGPDKAILYETTAAGAKEYKYTPENKKKLNSRLQEIKNEWVSKTLKFDAHYASEIPNNLSEEEKDVFKGIVIDPEHEIYKN